MSSPPIGSREDLGSICNEVASAAKTYFNHTNQQSQAFAKQIIELTLSYLKGTARCNIIVTDILLARMGRKKCRAHMYKIRSLTRCGCALLLHREDCLYIQSNNDT